MGRPAYLGGPAYPGGPGYPDGIYLSLRINQSEANKYQTKEVKNRWQILLVSFSHILLE
jgi:hypothetical protein